MTRISVKPYRSIILTIFLMSLLIYISGCMGGGGGNGIPAETDIPGITTSLNGFLSSVSSNQSNSYLAPKLKSITESEHNKGNISVWDFGADIGNPDDNASYSFSIPSDGIIQPSSDYAKAYAIANIGGTDFRIDFILIKTDGNWFIENLEFTNTNLGFISSSNLLPLQQNNSWQMIQIPSNASGSLITPQMVSASITEEPKVIDWHSVYWLDYVPTSTTYAFNLDKYSATLINLRQTDSWPILTASFQLTQTVTDIETNTDINVDSDTYPTLPINRNIKHIISQPNNIARMGFSNYLGLYFFGKDSVSSDRAVKLLNSLSTVGYIATDTISVIWSDGNSYSVYLAARLARKLTVQTFAGNFTAWQIDIYNHFTSAVPTGQSQDGYYSMLFAENQGIVAEVDWDTNQNATDILLMYSASVGGKTISAIDTGIDSNTMQFAFSLESPLKSAVVGRAYSQSMLSGGNSPYIMALQNGTLPAGIDLDSTGGISGTPSVTGNYSFILIATDSYKRTTNKSYEITVNDSLQMSSSPLETGIVGAEYSETLVSGGLPTYTLTTLEGSLPAGLSLNNDKLSGIPTTKGAFNFTISALDSDGFIATAAYVVNIEAPLTFSKVGTLPNGVVSESYLQNLITGGTPPYDLQLSSGILPSGIATNTLGLSGTPIAAGNFSFELRATDASGKIATSSFVINITTITSTLAFVNSSILPKGEKSTAYSIDIATGGVEPYSISLKSGSLPDSCNIDNNKISGMPSSAGNFTFELEVKDEANNVISQTFSLTVVETLYFEQAETIPDITVNQSYSNLIASGGATPYTFSLGTGSTLPSGIVLNASGLSGTPTATGSYKFTIGVTDQLGVTKEREFTLEVKEEAPKVPSIAWQKCIGGSQGQNNSEVARKVIQLEDGSYVVGGVGVSTDGDFLESSGNNDIWITHINIAQVIDWKYNDKSSTSSELNDLIKVSDGYIYVGVEDSSAKIGKISLDGVETWTKILGGGSSDVFTSVVEAPNGNYIVCGYSSSNDGDLSNAGHHGSTSESDAWILEFSNTDGYIVNQLLIGGGYADKFNRIILDSDSNETISNVTLVGETTSTDGDLSDVEPKGGTDAWIVHLKLDGQGFGISWQMRYGGSGTDSGNDIIPVTGGYVIAGSTNSSIDNNAGTTDMYIVKVTTDGTISWEKTYGGTATDVAYSINDMNDGTYNIAGGVGSSEITGVSRNWDMWMIQVNATTGIQNWQLSSGGAQSEQGFNMIKTNDNKNIIVGYTSSNDDDVSGNHALNYADWWIVKMQ